MVKFSLLSHLLNKSFDLSGVQQQKQHGKLVASWDAGGKTAKAITNTLQMLAQASRLAGEALCVPVLRRVCEDCWSCHQQLLWENNLERVSELQDKWLHCQKKFLVITCPAYSPFHSCQNSSHLSSDLQRRRSTVIELPCVRAGHGVKICWQINRKHH